MSDQYVIQLIANAWTGEDLPMPTYVMAMDFEARGGRGLLAPTGDINQAMHFATSAAAMEFWCTQSKRHPKRPDGKPNRPLTAYTVDIHKR